MQRALRRLEEESSGSGNRQVIKRLLGYLAPASDVASYRDAAPELNMTEAAVKAAVYRLRKRYRALFKDEIARTVATEIQVEEEIRFLFAALSG